ncbi:MAG TPA: methionyl-tRNA formyltransferase [Candidatus Dormibacteraeota bacterium]|nr:methionyl-tRNA formyltransferase [Candidatus Dormibacteraeota bacterium]
MRVVFAGSAEFSVPVLSALASSNHPVVGVLTAPDRAGSRGAAAPRPVRDAALALGLPLEQPPRLSGDFWRQSAAREAAEVLVVAAYGQLIPGEVLESMSQGGVGVHPSLLPRHRGAAPVAAAILAGDRRTGVTVFRMDHRMDAGPILAQQATPVPAAATRASLTERLAQLGAEMTLRVLERLEQGDVSDIPQLDSGATYSHRLSRHDGELEWSLAGAEIDRRVRALSPWPGVTLPLAGVRVKLLRGSPEPGRAGVGAAAAGEILEQTGDGILVATADVPFRVELVQPSGGRPMSPAAFLRGRRRALADHRG